MQQTLLQRGVSPAEIISLNFEVMGTLPQFTAESLHQEILQRMPVDCSKRAYVLPDEVQEVPGWNGQ